MELAHNEIHTMDVARGWNPHYPAEVLQSRHLSRYTLVDALPVDSVKLRHSSQCNPINVKTPYYGNAAYHASETDHTTWVSSSKMLAGGMTKALPTETNQG